MKLPRRTSGFPSSTGFRPLTHTSAMPRPVPLCALALTLCLAACATPTARLAPSPAPTGPSPAMVPERYVSAEVPGTELDSLATWPAEDGRTWLIATAKASHTLEVFDADSGLWLRSVGGKGAAPGQFLRPNGIAVFGNRVFVAERDNHRVQVLSLPDFAPLGTFGAAQLRSPYGLWLHETAPGELLVYVTDSFMQGSRHDVVPPLDQLDQRVRRYRVSFDDDGRVQARDEGAFGDTRATDALRIVESIAGDPTQQRLLIADESTSDESGHRGSTLREYAFDGRATRRGLPAGAFQAEAEGVALWSCGIDAGYWIAADQRYPLTRFLLFDRATLAPRGEFSGETVAHTDGIALHAASTATFAYGALFAVHDDKAVAAFDLGGIARAGAGPALQRMSPPDPHARMRACFKRALLLAGCLLCAAAVAADDDVGLRLETGDGGYLAWADNRLAGPVEVMLRAGGAGWTAEPALPARATVPAHGSVLVARLHRSGNAYGKSPGLWLDTVPGSVNAAPRDYEYLFPLRTHDLRVEQGWGGTYSHDDPENRRAVDFAAAIGTVVVAARDGVVMQLEQQAGASGAHADEANFVRILHDDGSMAVYAHLQAGGALVRPGQRVRRGQPIALSGNSGNSSGPHLHFAVQVNRGMRLESVPFRMFGDRGILRFSEPAPDDD